MGRNYSLEGMKPEGLDYIESMMNGQQPYPSQWNPQGAPQQAGGMPPQDTAPGNRQQGKGLRIVAIVGAFLAVCAVALAGYHLIVGPDTSGAEDTVAVAEPTTQNSGEPTKDSGAESQDSGEAKPELKGEYRVSGPTTDGFGANVRDAFMREYRKGGSLPESVTAPSPTTGLTYTMTCTPSGGEVHCTGGNDAHVYIR